MQRVSSLLPSWDKTKTNAANTNPPAKSRPSLVPVSLDKVFGWVDRSASARRASNAASSSPVPTSYGREAYWPTSLDKECEKAARILKSFCTDGFLALEEKGSRPSSPTAPTSPKFVPKKIPPRIIQNAVGLAIFSCMRSGLWMSGSGGSGILIARKADGTWSPPSGIMLHTAALGFVMGVDIYDCVLVINSVPALEVFMGPRTMLGSDVNLTVGPLVKAGLLENDIRWKELEGTVLTYVKARGQHQHVPLDGSLVTERGNENAHFYSSNVTVLDILAGNIDKSIPETRPIFEVIKAAEGRTDFDTALMESLSRQPAPGDAVIDSPTVAPLEPPRSPFGVPNADDPDPFGVIALEMAGLEIREAGSRQRPSSNQFEFNPAPTSPLFNTTFNRQSIDTYLSRSNRGSVMSSKSQGTQTDLAMTPDTGPSRNTSDDGQHEAVDKLPTVIEPEEVDYTKIDTTSIQHLRRRDSVREPVKVQLASPESKPSTLDHGSETDGDKKSGNHTDDESDADADDEDEAEDDESLDGADDTVVFEIATATAPTRTAIRSTQVTQVIHAKGALVTIPKRIPPPLPPRSAARTSRASKSEFGDVASLRSPLRSSFQSSDLAHSRAATPAIDEEASPSSGLLEPPNAAAHHHKRASLDAAAAEAAEEADKDVFQTPSEQPRSVSPPVVDNEGRLSTGSRDSKAPPTPPPIGDATSSGDELEHEPRTPGHEDTIASQDEKSDLKEEAAGYFPQVPPTTNANAVALV